MLVLSCDPANLTIVSNGANAGVAKCTNWIFTTVQPSVWDSMTDTEFNELLSAFIKFGFAAFFVWWLVWAARRF